MNEQTFALSVCIGLFGAITACGLLVGSWQVGQTIRRTEFNLKIGEVVEIRLINFGE